MEITRKTSYTRVDYDALPEGAPYQLIRGKLVMSPSPTTYHQRILLRLAVRLARCVASHGLGEVFIAPLDVYLSDRDAFQPDLIFVSEARRHIIQDKIEGAPDFVAEILSPSTAAFDNNQKKTVYARAGVREYWIIDPLNRWVDIHLSAEGSLPRLERIAEAGPIASHIIVPFSIDWAHLFE